MLLWEEKRAHMMEAGRLETCRLQQRRAAKPGQIEGAAMTYRSPLCHQTSSLLSAESRKTGTPESGTVKRGRRDEILGTCNGAASPVIRNSAICSRNAVHTGRHAVRRWGGSLLWMICVLVCESGGRNEKVSKSLYTLTEKSPTTESLCTASMIATAAYEVSPLLRTRCPQVPMPTLALQDDTSLSRCVGTTALRHCISLVHEEFANLDVGRLRRLYIKLGGGPDQHH